MAAFMDEGVGNVTQALKEAGMFSDTFIIFSADKRVFKTRKAAYPPTRQLLTFVQPPVPCATCPAPPQRWTDKPK
jgi:hypothetical protein